MNIRLPLLLLAALLAGSLLAGGCVTQYSHPTRPESLWNVDYDMCVVEADYNVVFHHYSTTASRPLVTSYDFYSPRYFQAVEQCMKAKGYLYEDDPKAVLLGEG